MLSADVFSDGSGKKWSAVIKRHLPDGGVGQMVWSRHNMRSQYAAETSLEAAWKRRQKEQTV